MTVAPVPVPRRVLILKPSSLGDVVGALPVLHGLRRTFPEAHLAWMVSPTFAEVLEGQPGLDEVILFQRRQYGRIGRSLRATSDFIRFCRRLRARRFDWVVDLQGLLRSGLLARVSGAPVRAGFADCREKPARWFYTHAVCGGQVHAIERNLVLARALGVDARAEDYRLVVRPEAQEWARSVLARHGLRQGQFVLAAPGTTWPNKVYPARLWRRALADLCADTPVVLTGSSQPLERNLCAELAQACNGRAVNLAGQTTLAQFVALIASAGAVVCSDTAANFIAPAVGVPSVALLGPTPEWYIGPYGGRGKALHADLPCLPCRKRRCRHVTCMQLIPPAAAAGAVREVLAAAKA